MSQSIHNYLYLLHTYALAESMPSGIISNVSEPPYTAFINSTPRVSPAEIYFMHRESNEACRQLRVKALMKYE
jgi:hypothetical protein